MSLSNVKDTRERILDTAERLFAHQGFYNTSLRMITADALANLAAVNYHFGSKEGLLEEVFKRRLIPLNTIRREQIETVLNRAAREHRPPSAADLLRAFIEPTVRFCCLEPGAEHFSTLVGRALAEPDSTVRNVFIHHIMPLFSLLFQSLREALPGLDRGTVFWRLQFALGATSHAMRIVGKHELLPPGISQEISDSGIDPDTLVENLLGFVTAGMEQ